MKRFYVLLSIFLFLIFLNCPQAVEEKEKKPGKWGTQLKITASDTEGWDYFGTSVSISGDYAIAGAIYQDDEEENSGAVYIYHRIGANAWDSGIKITASDSAYNDYFGHSVSISGDYAIVGAYGEDGIGSDLANLGAAYIFHRTGTNAWDSGIKITASDPKIGDNFGYSVSLSGDYAIVGTPRGGNGIVDGGAAYIFRRISTNTWDTGTKVTASDAEAGDSFGHSVSISGDYAIVSAYLEDSTVTDRGAAYIFHRTGTNSWDSGTKITAYDSADDDHFGYSVSLSGGYVIVGASSNDGSGTDRGAAYIFGRTGTNTWDSGTKITALDPADNDYFGVSVSISGDYIIVGSKLADCSGTDRGAAYIFHKTGINTWDTGIKITASDSANYDYFSDSVSISGDYAIVGADFKDGIGTNSGVAYIFK